MNYLLTCFLVFSISSCNIGSRSPSSRPSVLYIGDSQSASYLGGIIHKHLLKNFEERDIYLYGVGSSSPRHWSATRNEKGGKWLCSRKGRFNGSKGIPLNEKICRGEKENMIYSYLNLKKPDYVIFQFLGNSMGFNGPYIKEKITKLLNQDCLFITSPPYFHELKDKNLLRKQTENYFLAAIKDRCRLVSGMTDENLKGFAKDRDNYLGDKIHLSSKGADEFFKQIKPQLP
jgi:lysophospholipase L1-like esterase